MRLGSLRFWIVLGAATFVAASGCGGQSSQNDKPGTAGASASAAGASGSGLAGAGLASSGVAGSSLAGTGASGSAAGSSFSAGAAGTASSTGGTAFSVSGAGGSSSGGTSGSSGDAGAGSTSGGAGGAGGEPSSTEFPSALGVGVWVVGWLGNLDHYSWVRFTAGADASSGTWLARDSTCSACTGYVRCKDTPGIWSGTKPSDALYEVTLTPPAGCTDQQPHVWRFVKMAQPSYPPHAELAADLLLDQRDIRVQRYPSSACDAGFTECAW